MTEPQSFQPNWTSPPGDTIADLLAERGLSQAELAERTGFTKKHINELVHGRASITAETALKLEAVLGSTAAFWLRRESQYREATARRAEEAALELEADWLKELPLNHMVKHGWVKRRPGKGAQVAACLRFFGVADRSAYGTSYGVPLAAYRKSAKHPASPGAVAAWLRRGELEATELRCASWTPVGFRDALPGIRALTREPSPEVFLPKLVDACARVGVAVAIVRAPPGCPVSGATRFLSPEKAVLLLSYRFLRDDQFWFTFFHEAGHLLKHGKKALFVEGVGMSSAEEDEADRFARDFLIPPPRAHQLQGLRSIVEVRGFADECGIAPGIVVGRLQFDHRIGFQAMNGLKVSYSWPEQSHGGASG